MIVKVKEIRGVTLYVTESDAMPKKSRGSRSTKGIRTVNKNQTTWYDREIERSEKNEIRNGI